MKQIKYLFLALAAVAFTACMDGDWDAPDMVNAYGNAQLTETNVMRISDLKEKYDAEITATTNTYAQITDDVQIKGVITGNDIGGNLYNMVSVDDGTGCILIAISQGGLYGYLPVGQEILVNLKGLYIGGYGQQAQIGSLYTNKNQVTYVSRMSRTLWNDHFKLIGTPDASKVFVDEFDVSRMADQNYLKMNSGKLMTIKNVKLKGADGTATFAPAALKDPANSVNRELEGFKNTQIVVRTSTYADFAASVMPVSTVNLTGIFTRYRNTWQILIRQESDIHYVQ
ncbi:MAG: DUF5689 domain-containing protein [Prevotellaceae bacterium]|nr:DUF5689 domain-containing protein [Prevotellaceae bacterium]MDY3365335.1 DUF5689 domain-containing protein [Prevotella sp.]